LAINVKKSLTV